MIIIIIINNYYYYRNDDAPHNYLREHIEFINKKDTSKSCIYVIFTYTHNKHIVRGKVGHLQEQLINYIGSV